MRLNNSTCLIKYSSGHSGTKRNGKEPEKAPRPRNRNARRIEGEAKDQLDWNGIGAKIAPFFYRPSGYTEEDTKRVQIPAAGLEFITRKVGDGEGDADGLTQS